MSLQEIPKELQLDIFDNVAQTANIEPLTQVNKEFRTTVLSNLITKSRVVIRSVHFEEVRLYVMEMRNNQAGSDNIKTLAIGPPLTEHWTDIGGPYAASPSIMSVFYSLLQRLGVIDGNHQPQPQYRRWYNVVRHRANRGSDTTGMVGLVLLAARNVEKLSINLTGFASEDCSIGGMLLAKAMFDHNNTLFPQLKEMGVLARDNLYIPCFGGLKRLDIHWAGQQAYRMRTRAPKIMFLDSQDGTDSSLEQLRLYNCVLPFDMLDGIEVNRFERLSAIYLHLNTCPNVENTREQIVIAAVMQKIRNRCKQLKTLALDIDRPWDFPGSGREPIVNAMAGGMLLAHQLRELRIEVDFFMSIREDGVSKLFEHMHHYLLSESIEVVEITGLYHHQVMDLLCHPEWYGDITMLADCSPQLKSLRLVVYLPEMYQELARGSKSVQVLAGIRGIKAAMAGVGLDEFKIGIYGNWNERQEAKANKETLIAGDETLDITPPPIID